jgi:hypothetical protein
MRTLQPSTPQVNRRLAPMLRRGLIVGWATVSILLAGCGDKPTKAAAAAPVKPATTELIGHESELLKLKLTPAAETRLGLKTVAVGVGAARQTRTVHGEVVAAPPAGGTPITSTTDITTLAGNQARADGEVARLRAELAVAEKAYNRADALVKEEAGSVRARDEAEAARGVARANLAAAQAQRRLLGPAVGGLGRQSAVWIRAAAFASDIDKVDRSAPATVRGLGAETVGRSARPVQAPPSANLAAGTVDLYYMLPNPGNMLSIGQRVVVELPLQGQVGGLWVPTSAVLRDIYGGEWVYVRSAPQAYERRRVEIGSVQGAQLLVARGLNPGAEVVVAGAMELFGTEFGSK